MFEKLLRGEQLGREEMMSLFHDIASGALNDARIAAVLGALQVRGIAPEECLGALDALSASALKCHDDHTESIDVCGTGGDGKSTFNISTTAAFIIAGAGYQVVKNGNYGMSSKVGSSHVLEALGITFPRSPEELQVLSAQARAIFIHAPFFYPTLARVAEIRRALGVRTVFNLLGPLLNPARPRVQLCGVSSAATLELYAKVIPARVRKYTVVMSLDGYDEVSLTAPTLVRSYRGEFTLTPEDFGMHVVGPGDLESDGTQDSAVKTILGVLSGELGGAKEDVAVANAAIAIWTYDDRVSLQDSVLQARRSIHSGAALDVLKQCLDCGTISGEAR